MKLEKVSTGPEGDCIVFTPSPISNPRSCYLESLTKVHVDLVGRVLTRFCSTRWITEEVTGVLMVKSETLARSANRARSITEDDR